MRKVIFWDFDGTLAFFVRWSVSMDRALREAGWEVDLKKIQEHLKSGFTWHTPEISYAHATGERWWDNLFRHFEKLYLQVHLDKALWKQVNTGIREAVADWKNYTLFDDTVKTLNACRESGYTNYVLSNFSPELPDILKGLGLVEYLDGWVASAWLGYDKPRREIFEYAYASAGNPEWCCMIGDNPKADIAGAKALGWPAILVHNIVPCSADFCVKALEDIPELLMRIQSKSKPPLNGIV